MFRLVDDVAKAVHVALLDTEDAWKPVVRFDAEILARGFNALKSARVLLEVGHWEVACAAARQIFELLVNMEYVGSFADRDSVALKYVRFGLLQALRSQQKLMAYERLTGREVDPDRADAVDALLNKEFNDFDRRTDPTGPHRWRPNWSGKNIKKLAELSDDPMRVHQYEILFVAWSEQTHAAPATVLAGMFRQADEGWVEDVVARDDQQITEVGILALTLFLQLWSLLPSITGPEPTSFTGWMDRMRDLLKSC